VGVQSARSPHEGKKGARPGDSGRWEAGTGPQIAGAGSVAVMWHGVVRPNRGSNGALIGGPGATVQGGGIKSV
jgi:hypothetical protein